MKKYIVAIITLVYSFFCANMLFAAAGNTWTQKADFGATARSGAVGFSIGNKGYIGTGTTGLSAYRNDFWEYDPATNAWTQKADFAGGVRYLATGFSIGSKGYIGTGRDGSLRHNDFWEYDPAANTWTQKADFGGTARYEAVGFSIGSKGYIGTGWDSFVSNTKMNDFWEYDPAGNTWTRKTDFGGTGRCEAVGFSIGSKGYIGAGFDVDAIKDFWEYDPVADTWTRKADLGTVLSAAVGFSIGSKGYIGTGGGYANSDKKDFWEYDPAADIWTQKADFGGTARALATGFSIGGKGYIGVGHDSKVAKDFWEYIPPCTYALSPSTSPSFNYSGNTGMVTVTASSSGCDWTAVSNDSWITITAGSAGTGNGTVAYSVSANAETSTRTGTMTIAGQTFTVNQLGYVCIYSISSSSISFTSSGGTGSVDVNASSSGCDWTAVSNDSWITITEGSSGTGNGTVAYSVSANTMGGARTGTITVGGQTFTITQTGPCTYAIFPTSALFSSSGNTGAVVVVTSCDWTAVSNDSWITVTSGSSGTGSGTVTYSVAANTTGSTRTGTMTIGGETFTVTQHGSNKPLYFPHVDTSLPWQTEIAIINTSDQTVTGTLKAFSNEGQLIETKDITLSAHGRRQIIVANEFTNHINIGYIIFDTDSAAVQGYTKFYQAGLYRAAIPAVKEVNTSDIYMSHIDSSAQWWTGVSLVNTTPATKDLTIIFNNGASVSHTLNANEHWVFNIASLLGGQPPPGIQSAVITNASGVIGLELFGSAGWGTQLEGVLLTDKTTPTLYYPHVDNNGWWTGIVAYNPSASACTITITPYSALGTTLTSSTLPIDGQGKYIGAVAALGLPAETAWFKIDSTQPLSGFELFGTSDGNQLAAYAGGDGTGAKGGVFAKIEKSGWTGIAFVNTEDNAASVTLTAYNDAGALVATQVLSVGSHVKVVTPAEAIFTPQDISSATYIAYSSDRNIVGFQLNGSADGTMLDGLPGLGGTN
jgi:hypothetical protein